MTNEKVTGWDRKIGKIEWGTGRWGGMEKGGMRRKEAPK